MKMIILLFIFTVTSSWAQNSCAPLNLITQKDSPFNKIPVFDQDGLGICYSYTASQLIDYQLMKKGNKDRIVHPLWGALKFADSAKQESISSGTTYYAIKAIQDAGNCHLKSFDEAISTWTKKTNASESEIMGLVEKLAPKLGLLNTKVHQDVVDEMIATAIEEHSPYCSTNISWNQLMPELRSLSLLSSRKLLSNLVLPVCNKPSRISITNPRFNLPAQDEQWVPAIDSKLDELNAPIAVSYCARGLYDESYDGVNRKTATTPLGVKPDCSNHESIIAGKKQINGKCHFLLRNSWGSGFHSSNKDRKCLCKSRKTGKFLDDCQEELHNDGDNIVEACWISEDVFSKNAFGLTYLDKK